MTNIQLEPGQNLMELISDMRRFKPKIRVNIGNNSIHIETVPNDEAYTEMLDYVSKKYKIIEIELDEVDIVSGVSTPESISSVENVKAKETVETIKEISEILPKGFSVQKYKNFPYSTDALLKLDRSIGWIMSRGAKDGDIEKFIYSLLGIMSMNYSEQEVTPVIGDIYLTRFGTNLPLEISGTIFSLVIDINPEEELVLVVPIAKYNENATSNKNHLDFDYTGMELVNPEKELEKGTFIIEKTRWIHWNRLKSKICSATPELIARVKGSLNTLYDFAIETEVETASGDSFDANLEDDDEDEIYSYEESLECVKPKSPLINNHLEYEIDWFIRNLGLKEYNDFLRELFLIASGMDKISKISINGLYSKLIEKDSEMSMTLAEFKEKLKPISAKVKERNSSLPQIWSFVFAIKDFTKKHLHSEQETSQ